MSHSKIWSILVVTIAVAPAGLPPVIAQTSTRTIYVSATDKKGVPITDLDAADLEVKIGGKQVEVISAKPAVAPLRIAVVDSDAGTGAFQLSIARFMQRLAGHAEFALFSVIVQPERIVDYTSDGGALNAGIRKLGPRGRERGAQLLEAIQEIVRDVRREGTRSVILITRVGAEAATPLSGDQVKDDVRKSGAILYVVSTIGAQRAAPPSARVGISAEQAQLHDEENVQSALNLGQVLGDGAKDSGGRHEHVVSTTLVPALEQIADELLHQYAVACAVPATVRPTDRLSITTKRKGITVRAPSRLPQFAF
jgi:hypothetical protein